MAWRSGELSPVHGFTAMFSGPGAVNAKWRRLESRRHCFDGLLLPVLVLALGTPEGFEQSLAVFQMRAQAWQGVVGKCLQFGILRRA